MADKSQDNQDWPFGPTRRPSRAERRAAAERSARRKAARAGAVPVLAAGPSPSASDPAPTPGPSPAPARRSLRTAAGASETSAPTPGHSDTTATTVREAAPDGQYALVDAVPARPSLRFFVAVALASLAAVSTVHLAGPVVEPGWDMTALSIGTGATMGLAWLAWWASAWVPRRTMIAGFVLAAVLVGSYAVGMRTQVIIDGRPYLSTSSEARSYRMAIQMRDDLYAMVEHDRLLEFDSPEAKANFDRYAPATEELLDLNRRYTSLTDSELPGPEFVAVRDHLKSAAFFGSQAMEAKGALTIQNDAALAAQVDANRATFAQEILTAGSVLREAAGIHDIELTPGDEDPRE